MQVLFPAVFKVQTIEWLEALEQNIYSKEYEKDTITYECPLELFF